MDISKELEQDLILLGKHIKKLRDERSLSIKELAQKTSMRVPYLEKIEKGMAIRVSTFRHLLKIAIALNVKFADILNLKNITKQFLFLRQAQFV